MTKDNKKKTKNIKKNVKVDKTTTKYFHYSEKEFEIIIRVLLISYNQYRIVGETHEEAVKRKSVV